MIVIADTSGILTLCNSSDPDHLAARKAVDQCGLLVASPMALTEVHQVATIRAGRRAADAVMRVLMGHLREARLVLAEVTPALLDMTLTVRARYDSLDLDLVDAMNVALAADYDTDAVLTRDLRDFRAVRPLGRRSGRFRILPDDL
ncbi:MULTISPECIES: PIN domain-containing protein [unclassified Streptomyces]|uniref:PIN domain-containing protein n=1 Tax=unclassified Streptomyces TaxID=2593676 RepID=UPI00278BE8CC|nr:MULTISPECIES: PIN domain-containing protein [unclassified Streptomyces]